MRAITHILPLLAHDVEKGPLKGTKGFAVRVTIRLLQL